MPVITRFKSVNTMQKHPKIQEVEALPGRQLLVRFRNGVVKLYDCKKVLRLPAFAPLRENDALFQCARADPHGYAVVWNDELDLAESEVWLGGKVVREDSDAYGRKPVMKSAGKVVRKPAATLHRRSLTKTPKLTKTSGRKP